MTYLLAFLRRRPRVLAALTGWSLLEALPAVLSGQAVARAVDQGFLAGRPLTGVGWLALLAAAVLIGAVGTRNTFRCLAALAEPLRDDLVRHVVTGALHGGGGVVARLTHQVEIVRDTFAGLVMTVRGFLFAVAGALLGLASLAPVVVLLVAPPLILGLGVFAASLPGIAARQRAYVRTGEELSSAAGAAFAGLRDVAACGAGDRVAEDLARPVRAQAAAERAVARGTALRGLSIAVGGWLPLVVVLLATPWLVRRGLTAGAVLGALTYLLHGVQPALNTLVGGVAGGGVRLLVTVGRLLDTPAPSVRSARPSGAGIVLRGVTFAYGAAARPVVDGLDLTLRDGDHLAILGPSGIGKSTLVGLLAGTLAPQRGEVLLGGVPPSQVDPAVLARHRVLIPQEAYVFTGTLRDNLRYLRPAAALRDLDRAVDAVGMRDLKRRLGGYDAEITPDRLSAGERQLVALTRAYLSPAPLVLLDEATSHLDAAAAARAEEAFAERPGALVIVAHCVTAARRATRILLLDGVTATLGSHDALRRSSPLYRDLVEPAGALRDAYRLQPVPGTGFAQDR